MAWNENPPTHPRAKKTMPRWVWGIVSLVPALFILLGVGFVAEAIVFFSNAQSTQGQVVEIRREYDDGSVSYTPTIRYSRSDGRTFEAVTHISSSSYDFDLGAQVDILYAFDDPNEVRIDSFFSLYGIGLIFAVTGGLFLRIITWVRRKASNRAVQAGAAARAADRRAGYMQAELLTEKDRELEEVEDELAAIEDEDEAEDDNGAETDPGKEGHIHEPKPKRSPTIRRMR